MTPSTPEEDRKHIAGAVLSGIPEPDARLNMSGGFLIYEELEDEVGDIENMAAEEYEAHNERLNARSGGAQKAKVLRRKSFTTYTKHFGGADQSGSSKRLDLHAVANLSLANDKEYNDRMLTLGRKAGKSKHMTEKQSQAALTLDRYKLTIPELYGKPLSPVFTSCVDKSLQCCTLVLVLRRYHIMFRVCLCVALHRCGSQVAFMVKSRVLLTCCCILCMCHIFCRGESTASSVDQRHWSGRHREPALQLAHEQQRHQRRHHYEKQQREHALDR